MIILVEGINGTGKTTLCKSLEEHFEGSVYIQEPGTTKLGKSVRGVLAEKTANSLASVFLYSAARAQLIEETIKPLVAQGKTVILDRFTPSTMAYQHYGDGGNYVDIELINNIASEGVLIDRKILLVCPVHIAAGRSHKGNWTPTNGDYQNRVQRGYLKEAYLETDWCVLDSLEDSETVFASAASFINDPEGTITYVGSFGILGVA